MLDGRDIVAHNLYYNNEGVVHGAYVLHLVFMQRLWMC